MGENPVESLRRKKESSVAVATRLVKSGEASAMVSAGNTGACVAAGTVLLGLLPEVRRAGIAVCLHAGTAAVVVIDVGANISSKPEHLIQYGIMANLYSRTVLRVENPRIGLLNIGEEHEKGNALVKSTHALFRKTKLNFLGNVEGVEIFRGVCDVLVCDGFVGNIVLKVSEGLAEQLVDLFRATTEQVLRSVSACSVPARGVPAHAMAEVASTSKAGIAELESVDPVGILERRFRGAMVSMRERIDYAEYGGAPLLGVNGVSIIAHGRSDAKAITNAVRVAKRMVETDMNRHIAEEIHAFSERS
jgi:glycerol-3-phosphate acyltransferase PlsX